MTDTLAKEMGELYEKLSQPGGWQFLDSVKDGTFPGTSPEHQSAANRLQSAFDRQDTEAVIDFASNPTPGLPGYVVIVLAEVARSLLYVRAMAEKEAANDRRVFPDFGHSEF